MKTLAKIIGTAMVVFVLMTVASGCFGLLILGFSSVRAVFGVSGRQMLVPMAVIALFYAGVKGIKNE